MVDQKIVLTIHPASSGSRGWTSVLCHSSSLLSLSSVVVEDNTNDGTPLELVPPPSSLKKAPTIHPASSGLRSWMSVLSCLWARVLVIIVIVVVSAIVEESTNNPPRKQLLAGLGWVRSLLGCVVPGMHCWMLALAIHPASSGSQAWGMCIVGRGVVGSWW